MTVFEGKLRLGGLSLLQKLNGSRFTIDSSYKYKWSFECISLFSILRLWNFHVFSSKNDIFLPLYTISKNPTVFQLSVIYALFLYIWFSCPHFFQGEEGTFTKTRFSLKKKIETIKKKHAVYCTDMLGMQPKRDIISRILKIRTSKNLRNI